MIEPGVILNGRYKVLRAIGEGGMGAVFEAEHTGVGRKVAIKVLHAQYADNQEIVERFEREARSAAAIGHDNIIDILDTGSHEGSPFMIMEFLKGESLGHRIEKTGKLSVPSAVHVMRQVLSALAAAHKVGIVHRDLKPDNVFLIQKAGVADFVKLLDFGISKFRAEEALGGKALTQAGAMMGTPYYMAPEQALARKDIDHRADIYSAGIMLYEMITGRLPFEAESQTELLLAIVHGSDSFKPPTTYVPDLPGGFEDIILKAMSRDRDARFADCAEFIAALDPFADESALPAAGPRTRSVPPPGNTNAHKAITPLNWEQSKPADASAALPAVTASPATTSSSRARGGIIAVGGATVVLAIVGFLALRKSPTPAQAPQAATQAAAVATPGGASSGAPGGSTGTTPAPESAQRVSVDVEGLPVGAVLSVDGQTSSTQHLSFERGSTHQLRVTAPGMQPFELSFRAERDRSIAVAMVAVAAPATAAAGGATAPAAAGGSRGSSGGSQGAHGGRGAHAAASGSGGASASGGSGGSAGGSGGSGGSHAGGSGSRGGSGHAGPVNMQVDTTY